MTDIEKKAISLVNEVLAEEYGCAISEDSTDAPMWMWCEALCRALEQHEAFRREVSDAIEAYYLADYRRKQGNAVEQLNRFIIPAPVDPLVEVLADMGLKPKGGYDWASEFHTTLAARGYKIVKEAGE